MELGWQVLVALVALAVVAGFLDTLAGGGGLLTLPALLLAGVPPVAALGTNKLQGTFGTAMASSQVLRRRAVTVAAVRWPMLAAFLGAGAGACAVQRIDASPLRIVIVVVLAAIVVYVLAVPGAHRPPARPRVSPRTYDALVVPAIGAYDGAFGPGTGSLFALSGVALRARGLIESTAVAKTLNFATNAAALIVFAVTGHVWWLVGLAMGAGQAVGALVGSHVLLRVSPVVIRAVIAVMCIGMLLRVVATS